MSYRIETNGADKDLVFEGWENGIARSPLSGVGNLQSINISTENKEVMCSYSRIQQSQSGTTATAHADIVPNDSTHLQLSDTFFLRSGTWITVTASTITGLSAGAYYVQNSNGAPGVQVTSFQLSSFYNSATISGLGGTGAATFNIRYAMSQPIAACTEAYFTGGQQYRYYVLDSAGLVWVYDTAVTDNQGRNYWFLPDPNAISGATGIAVLNGFLHVFAGFLIYVKPTVNLGSTVTDTSQYSFFLGGASNIGMMSALTHYPYVGHQGKLYYTDGKFIGSIFPNTTLLGAGVNIQSYASYTASGTTGTMGTVFGGSVPYDGSGTTRIPAVFFHSLTASAANPSALTLGTIYYIKFFPDVSAGTFEVYAAASGGSALNLANGAVGTQYFSTYYPASTGGSGTITFTPEHLNLPFFETATALAEVGNTVIIGTKGNTLYPWNQTDPTPSDIIPLPESNTVFLLTVNNMAYIFAGNKGNIYVTNGSTASLVITVPDYCAGIAGTPGSYIEPYFVWGGAMYLRGRVYFSILDQTTAKTGNCGGIWSFVPTQNFFIGQDTGLSLRLENQNSYGTYNGVATVLLAAGNQAAISPQYFSGWYSSVSAPIYGIDFTDTVASTNAVIETDIVPVGTLLNKHTFKQIEYKLSAPLISGESVSLKYRTNLTDAFSSFTSPLETESTTALSGYYPADIQGAQWLQIQATLTPAASSTGSFVRLTQIRAR